MNERLKELMIQADYPAPELALRAHRLAELIVKECIKAYNDDGYQTEYEQDQKVLKHFGVEE